MGSVESLVNSRISLSTDISRQYLELHYQYALYFRCLTLQPKSSGQHYRIKVAVHPSHLIRHNRHDVPSATAGKARIPPAAPIFNQSTTICSKHCYSYNSTLLRLMSQSRIPPWLIHYRLESHQSSLTRWAGRNCSLGQRR